jgi:hypothetical protein
LINREDIRIGLLRSFEEAASLFQRLQVELKEMKELDVELCTNLEREILRLSAAVQVFQTGAGIVPVEVRAKKILPHFEEAPPGRRKPDYVHWARLAYWTDYDAVALAAGRDPELVDWTESNHLLDWVRAAVEQGTLREPISPAAFMHWVDRLGDRSVSLPEELRQAIANHQSIDFGADKEERPDETRRSTLESNSSEYDPDSVAEDMEDKKGRLTASPRTFRTTQKLLAYFMNSAGLIDLSSEEMPPVVHSQAAEIAASMQRPPLTDKTVLKHLKDAAMTARQAMGKSPPRQDFPAGRN